jgi:hypothetical protein
VRHRNVARSKCPSSQFGIIRDGLVAAGPAGVKRLEVHVLVDDSVPEGEREHVDALVRKALEGQPEGDPMVVSVVKLRGGGWNVFVNNLEDRTLIESLEETLRREVT